MRVVDVLEVKTKKRILKLLNGMNKTIDEWKVTQKGIWQKGEKGEKNG